MRFVPSLACLAALIAGVLFGRFHQDPNELIVFSVGQGDCALLRVDGHAILIDDGPGEGSSGLTITKLKEYGIDDLDAILLSHPDMDHVAETPELLKEFPRARVVMSDQFRNYRAMVDHLTAWKLPDRKVVWLPARSSMQMGPFSLLMECPPFAGKDNDNNGCMFVRVSTGQGLAVFSGDAPKEVEQAMEPLTDWHAEILHVGHHGSKTATDETWIQAVKPSWAVISVGRTNNYGHPNKETLHRLANDHIPTLRTDRNGDIVFDFDGGKFVRQF